ncbi:MAG: EcsC family protein [Persicimonas sp.]
MNEETNESMSNETNNEPFIKPDAAELTEAGLLEESSAAVLDEVSAELSDELEEDFKARWRAILEMPPADVLERVASDFERQPERVRETLSLLIAQELGYKRLFRGRDSLQHKPLWEVLGRETFAELGGNARLALERIARSTRAGRPAFHPMAALATIALWRHGDIDQQAHAAEALGRFALPDEPEWLYELVNTFVRLDETADDGRRADRSLMALARLQLDASFWDSAALVGGLFLVSQFTPSWVGSPMSNLVKACDRAAEREPQQMRPWLDLLADAAMGGRLTYPWLEKPARAAIRLAIDDPERERTLRDWHQRRPYDADHPRLADLYEVLLAGYESSDEDERAPARRALLDEVSQTVESNPVRAQRLLELMVMREHPRRVGTLPGRLAHALAQVAEKPKLSDTDEELIRLYVRTYNIEPHAVRVVRHSAERIDWADPEREPGVDELDMYLVVSDYERAFEHLTCKFDGVTLAHADKDAAARVKYFVEKRLDPNSLTRIVRKLFTPIEWIGASITNLDFISKVVERALTIFDDRVSNVDMTERVVQEYRESGAPVERFADIQRLTMNQVDELLRNRKTMRLMLSAVAGGISGGLAPFSWAALSLADAPILLGLTADICSRFCWYYGFDPRENPDLPMEIMAVALGGSRAAAIEPMLLRQNLREYAVRKSLMVGAVAHGGVTQIAGRTLGKFMNQQVGQEASKKVTDLARRAVTKNMQRRAAESIPSRTLPLVGAVLGASLNVALIYDVCEAAQAVLTDRFLERKYPDWIRRFELGVDEQLETEIAD